MSQPQDDPLTDFDARSITLEGATRVVYVGGPLASGPRRSGPAVSRDAAPRKFAGARERTGPSLLGPAVSRDASSTEFAGGRERTGPSLLGPAVIVMAEMPGISPDVARFARWVRGAGFTVYMPSLFGRDGAYPEAASGLAVLKRACVSAEFRAFAKNEASPVTRWLRGLARLAHGECGGPGVGAIGMCFTGNFALSMMLEASVLAPVLCQPSLPFDQPTAIESPPDELVTVRRRLEREDLTVRAYRFEDDPHCPAQRFAAYAAALGPRFEATVLPSAAANPTPPPFFATVVGGPHSVVTAHLIDEAGQPTIAARDDILQFFRARLLAPGVARDGGPS